MNEKIAIIKVTQKGNTVFNVLFQGNLGKVFNYVVQHFMRETHFTSNEYSRKKMCERLQINDDIYFRSLKKLVDNKVLIKQAQGYYILNYNLIEISDAK